MANVDEVSKLKVDQLKELAAEHNVELADGDKKDDIVSKVSSSISPEQLEAYNAKASGDNGGLPPEGTGTAPVVDKDIENQEATDTVKAHQNGATEVDTKLGTSVEEDAAKRAGVSEEHLEDPRQNREPKNEFEQENQKVTEDERVAAQEASDMTTKEKIENAPAPSETAKSDAVSTATTNQGSDIAQAIAEGFKASKDSHFVFSEDPGVEHRFTLVKNKQTGEVMLRENETGTLSKLQLLSLEEKEADIQATEVEEL